uniref:Anoctamin n=1 Tax=Romanomermis culicivorax TaxID=13658 RepID=A0A915IZ74_ROMCU
MFAASFPLAPMIALLISLFDVRFEVKRLLWILRRPVAFIASDIGMWFPIMRFVCFCGVISNGFIVAFTSSFCEDFFETDDVPTTQRLLVFITFEHVVFGLMYLFHICIPSTPANIRLAQRRERYEVMRILERNKYLNRKDLYDSSLCLSSDEDLKNTPSTAKKSNCQQSESLGVIRTPVFLLTDVAENS